MIAKEFFREVRDSQRAIWAIKHRQERYMDMATCLGGMSESTIRSTERRSRVETAALELVDLSQSLGPAAAGYVQVVQQAERVLQAMPTSRYQELLTRRYILGEKWEAIGAAMQYHGEKSVYKAHGWALREAQKILDEMIHKDT